MWKIQIKTQVCSFNGEDVAYLYKNASVAIYFSLYKF